MIFYLLLLGVLYRLAWALLVTYEGQSRAKQRNKLRVPTPFVLLTADVWGLVGIIFYYYEFTI